MRGEIFVVTSLTHAQRAGLAMLAAALVLGMSLPRAAAQLTTGTVFGSVQDVQSAAVPGATLRLTSETRGTRLPEATSGAAGEFVFSNVTADTYTLEASLKGFKTVRRTGIAVSPGDRVGLGQLTLEVGEVTEQVTVSAEAVQIQTQSSERSFTIAPTSVRNLPLANRSFTQLLSLTPGVSGITRISDRASTGGGDSNIMMDGISTMDSGNNGAMFIVNTESVAEVKVLVSNYQAEYGRSSGLQITSVTKSGTSDFHGTGFIIMRKSRWNNVSKTTMLNGETPVKSSSNDIGFTVGGPIGKPGRPTNKVFFFYSHEFDPRTFTGSVTYYRFPTALERAGDFSQSTDNLGKPYPYIKDPLSSSPCSASNTSGCFKDGGVLGRIPANRLYSPGLAVLNLFPQPNLATPAVPYNYAGATPEQSIMSQQPVMKIDVAPWSRLRGSFKYGLWGQTNKTYSSTLPGFNDSKVYNTWMQTWASTVVYTLNPTTVLEGTFGRSQNQLTGCIIGASNTSPAICNNGLPMNPISSLKGAGLGDLPLIFPDAGVINPSYFAYKALEVVKPPIWDGTRLSMVPAFSWGSRITNSPSNFPFPGYLNSNIIKDVAISLTKVAGHHTMKTGFYLTHSYKAQQRQGWAGTISFANDTQNPLDSGFGFSNAALGVFSSYQQNSRYIEGDYVYYNYEGFVQDNWRVNNRLTLDYGVRLVHLQPQYDKLGQAANFIPEQWSLSKAPVLYGAGCAAQPCTGANRQALNPLTGQLLGPNTAVAIGTLVPNSGNSTNGLFLAGQGPVPTTYNFWPMLVASPRFGAAYDVTGEQKFILRAGAGMYTDRTSGNSVFPQVANPPTQSIVTSRYSSLQSMSGLSTQAAPSLNVYQLESGLPTTWTWSGGVQLMLPNATMLDVSYNGQHSYNLVEGNNINSIDFGSAFLPQYQDPTVSSSLPGGAAVSTDLMRAIRGYGGITQNSARGWFTGHTLQISVNRRFAQGLSYGFSDTITLSQKGSTTARYQHNADGSFALRSDQAQADELLGNYVPTSMNLQGNFVWNIPGLKSGNALKWATNGWSLSGIWTASTGPAYTISTSYQSGGGNQNITGSPDWAGRVRIIGDPGSGCDLGNRLQQFNTAAFAGPLVGSLGLESGADYLRGCFQEQLDLGLAREIRLGETRRIELRLDAFNVPNEARITARNTTMNVTSPTDSTIQNLPFDSAGNVIASRSQPKNAGFGVATNYQTARNIQFWIRFTF